jgi:hypothetical protein
VAPLVLALVTGCASRTPGSGGKVPVSVSAANYSRLSDEQLYNELHAPVAAPAAAPDAPKAPAPHGYLLMPGEVYPNDVPMGAVYREVDLALGRVGYVDCDLEKRAGRVPPAIDYLLRVHYGKRPWFNPSVRGDRITWGNDGLVASRYRLGLMSDWERDSREGQSPQDLAAVRRMFAVLGSGFGMGGGSAGGPERLTRAPTENSMQQSDMALAGPMMQELESSAASDYFLIVVEAFRFDDVERMDKKAPCVWAVFIAVPAEGDRRFSDVLRSMLQAGAPYFGETTHGLQVFQVPAGKVIMGSPEVVP